MAKKRSKSVVACVTPHAQCTGGVPKLSGGVFKNTPIKVHRTSLEAYNCYKAYLLSEGYVPNPDSARTFSRPGDEVQIVLTKPSKFGSTLRGGKEGTRHMPKKHPSGMVRKT